MATPPEQTRVPPPDLILQAIVPPTDAPAEIRAAVAHVLSNRELTGTTSHGWQDVSFAASALAFAAGTDQRAEPDTQWVFALAAQAPKLGEQIRSCGGWSSSIHASTHASAGKRMLWRVSVFDALTTSPRAHVS